VSGAGLVNFPTGFALYRSVLTPNFRRFIVYRPSAMSKDAIKNTSARWPTCYVSAGL
jgi:hypothetical protein